MDNTFTNAARKVATYTTTENGHDAVSTTGAAVLDLYGLVGALRGADKNRIQELFARAIAEDKLLAARTMFYARDARGGVGERDVFRTMLHYAAIAHPEIVRPNLKYIPEFGRWDDVYALVDTPLEKQGFELMENQLHNDLAALKRGESISLLAKWLKSCNASSWVTRRLGELTAKYFGLPEAQYRRVLSRLRNAINIVETQMSQSKWSEIDYSKLPSRAGLVHREAFKRHDEDRYFDFITQVNEGKTSIHTAMNTPQDLVHVYMEQGDEDEDPTVEAMWKNLPNFVGTDENILCMVDVSGSMNGRPMEVSTGLGMYFAQRNTGAFHNLMLTFESKPAFVALREGASLRQCLMDTLRMGWGGSTNLTLACQEILDFAKKNHIPDKDMPRRFIIISDMEIDDATRDWTGYYRYKDTIDRSNILHCDELRAQYAAAGYTMPQVIYWNVASRDNRFQTQSDVPGTMLASGSSPAIFKALMEMKDLNITPLDAMREVLNSERYSVITVE